MLTHCYLCGQEDQEDDRLRRCRDCGRWVCWEHSRDFPTDGEEVSDKWTTCWPCIELHNKAVLATWREMYARGETLSVKQLRWIGKA